MSAATTPGLGLLSGKASLLPLLEPRAAPFEKTWELCMEEGGPPGVLSVPLCPATSRELCTGVCVCGGVARGVCSEEGGRTHNTCIGREFSQTCHRVRVGLEKARLGPGQLCMGQWQTAHPSK